MKDRLSEIRNRWIKSNGAGCQCRDCQDMDYLCDQLDRSQQALEIAKEALEAVAKGLTISRYVGPPEMSRDEILVTPETVKAREALARIGEL